MNKNAYVMMLERSKAHQEAEMLKTIDNMILSLKGSIAVLESAKEYAPEVMKMKVDDVVDNTEWKARQFNDLFSFYSEQCVRLDAIKEYSDMDDLEVW